MNNTHCDNAMLVRFLVVDFDIMLFSYIKLSSEWQDKKEVTHVTHMIY